MATFAGIAAVVTSVERLLQARFVQDEPISGSNTHVTAIRSEGFASDSGAFVAPALTVFLYRVELNRTMRPAWSGVGFLDGQGHLPLDLYLLLTPWGVNAEDEHRILGRAMEALEATPILTGPLLHPSGGWSSGEAIQLVFDDVPAENVMRLFDLLPGDYKLSVPYLARVMRIDARPATPDPPAATLVLGGVPSSEPPP